MSVLNKMLRDLEARGASPFADAPATLAAAGDRIEIDRSPPPAHRPEARAAVAAPSWRQRASEAGAPRTPTVIVDDDLAPLPQAAAAPEPPYAAPTQFAPAPSSAANGPAGAADAFHGAPQPVLAAPPRRRLRAVVWALVVGTLVMVGGGLLMVEHQASEAARAPRPRGWDQFHAALPAEPQSGGGGTTVAPVRPPQPLPRPLFYLISILLSFF